MRQVSPQVRLVSSLQLDWDEIDSYLADAGASAQWVGRRQGAGLDTQSLAELAGRLCYDSFEVGLNPNITKIRESQEDYLQNLLRQAHGSVFEHINFTFLVQNCSRVYTHELVRHRVGTAYSQESMRFVRLTEIPFWIPEWVVRDEELMERLVHVLEVCEEFQRWAAQRYGLDGEGVKFSHKKHVTSLLRRVVPQGVATNIAVTVNVRALRHIIEMRTSMGAEEEIRLITDQMARLASQQAPQLFADFHVEEDGTWIPQHHKV